MCKLADRAAVLLTIQGEGGWRLIQARFAREGIDRAHHISYNRHPVGLTKVDNMTCSMSGRMDDTKSGYLVTLVEDTLDWIRWPSKQKLHEPGGDGPGLHLLPCFL